jgi:hypothetical protein
MVHTLLKLICDASSVSILCRVVQDRSQASRGFLKG